MPRSARGRALSCILGALFVPAAVTLYVPQALAFPYEKDFGSVRAYGSAPLPADLADAIVSAQSKLESSPLGAAPDVDLFLTEGGPRWSFLSVPSGGAFAVTRPGGNAIIVNRLSADERLVVNGRNVGGERPLADVIAHEMVHIELSRQYGIKARFFDARRVEGFADYVAGGSSLTDAEADAMIAAGQSHPALAYNLARREAAAALAAGQTVDAFLSGD